MQWLWGHVLDIASTIVAIVLAASSLNFSAAHVLISPQRGEIASSSITHSLAQIQSSTTTSQQKISKEQTCPDGMPALKDAEMSKCDSIPIASTISVDTSKWKTYIDPSGYVVKFPPGIDILHSSASSTDFILDKALGVSATRIIKKDTYSGIAPTSDVVDYNNLALTFHVTVSANTDDPNISVKDWAIKNALSGRQVPIPSLEEATTVDDVPAYYAEYRTDTAPFWQSGFARVMYFVMYHNKIYTIWGVTLPLDMSEVSEPAIEYVQAYDILFSKMLATFAFRN